MYRVIIIEDDPMVAEIDKAYTEHNGKLVVVGVFSMAQPALDYLRNNPVELILLDFFLPHMNGLDFLIQLRQEGYTQPVIMITAANDPERIVKLQCYGVMDYLIKPFDYPRFQLAMNKFVARQETLAKNDTFTQGLLDKMMIPEARDSAQYVDKGIQAPTLQLIISFLKQHQNERLSIDAIVKEVPLSRVTIRRYMNHLAEKKSVLASVDYSTGGRPSSIYTYIGEEN